MRALIDTCVVMDAIQNRAPFAEDAQAVFLAVANQMAAGCITAKEMTDIFYLTHRCTHDQGVTRTIMGRIGMLFDILDTTEDDVRQALMSNMTDYEDAVMVETAKREKMDCIVTRNLADYKQAGIPVYSPREFMVRVKETSEKA